MARRRLSLSLLSAPAAVLLLAAARVASAQGITDRYWIDSLGGSFTDVGNWSSTSGGAGGASAPTSSNTATFRRGAGASYPVTFPGKINFPFPVYEMNQLRVGANTVAFSDALTGLQGPGTVNVTNANTGPGVRGIIVGLDSLDTNAVLTTSLAHLNAVALTVGNGLDSVGVLNVAGGNLTVTGSSAADDEFIAGNDGNGTLNITGGAHVDLTGANGNLRVAKEAGSHGTVTIDGPGSQLTASQVAHGSGNGSIHVTGGGTLNTAIGTVSGVEVYGPGSTWNVSGNLGGFPLVGGGGVVSVGGNLTMTDAYQLNIGGGATVIVAGKIDLSASASLSVAPLNLNISASEIDIGPSCKLIGPVAITGNVVSKGLVKPYRSSFPGMIQVTGDFTEVSAAPFGPTLDLLLSHDQGGDRLQVSGDLTLAGTLNLTQHLNSPFEQGDSFDILNWDGTLTGAFDEVVDDLRPSLTWDLSQLYSTGVVTIVATLAGDFDTRFGVAAADLDAWETNAGLVGSAVHAQGDADYDHDVDGADLVVWQQQLGSQATAEAAGSAVPEPAGVLLALVGCGECWRRGRRVRPVAACGGSGSRT